jgi:hypothetical protein
MLYHKASNINLCGNISPIIIAYNAYIQFNKLFFIISKRVGINKLISLSKYKRLLSTVEAGFKNNENKVIANRIVNNYIRD